MISKRFLFFFFPLAIFAHPKVELGVDRFFKEGFVESIQGKRIGIVSNHTGVDSSLKPTITRFLERDERFKVVALFGPEHGIDGKSYASESIGHKKTSVGIPVYSLHGSTKRPTKEMLKNIDAIIYDIQDIGSRSYTYASTLYYVMEEAAKAKIEVIVLDRPNPMGGEVVDGPMLEKNFRSFLGYINVPYCHGMTIGELARLFNAEYKIGCKLTVIPMSGWKREMLFSDTGLHWIPTSPHIPEEDTPFFYATTGILGELDIVNIGVGYTLPFKVVGAPWVNAEHFASVLNQQKIEGVLFTPIHYRPFYGSLKGKECHGVKIHITDSSKYHPLTVQYFIIGVLKTLYPEQVVGKLLGTSKSKRELFNKVVGNDSMIKYLTSEKYVAWKLIEFQKDERLSFSKRREKYLLYK